VNNFAIVRLLCGNESQFIVSINGWLQGSFDTENKANNYIKLLVSQLKNKGETNGTSR
jgi:hypothetical protein